MPKKPPSPLHQKRAVEAALPPRQIELTQVERFALRPLDPNDLVARGFNPDGTPQRGTTYHDIIALVQREDPETYRRKAQALMGEDYSFCATTKEVLVRKAMLRAELGDQKALDWLAEREEGKVTQSFTLTNEDKTQAQLAELRAAVGIGDPDHALLSP